MNQVIHDVEAVAHLLADADHIDVKTFESEQSLREFIAGLFTFNPWWLKALYGVRWAFVRVLGMKQEGIPDEVRISAENIPMTQGEPVMFFTVESAEEDKYYVAGAKEKHLDAYLAVVREPLGTERSRFHLVTIVHYQHWTGPVYFNVIRPFHHIVARSMGNAAVKHLPMAVMA